MNAMRFREFQKKANSKKVSLDIDKEWPHQKPNSKATK
jgi:hypothetical protein